MHGRWKVGNFEVRRDVEDPKESRRMIIERALSHRF
jgi:hypothetical protein